MSDVVVVSYDGAELTLNDISLFTGRNWLNASNINFSLRWTHHRLNLPNSVLLLDPIVASFMRLQMEDADEANDLQAGIVFKSREWIIVPINDAENLQQSGSHWSLLLHHTPSNTSLHFDSSPTKANNYSALQFSRILSELTTRQPSDPYPNPVHRPVPLITAQTPHQSDGVSCGLYACLFAHHIAQFVLSNSSLSTRAASSPAPTAALAEIPPPLISALANTLLTSVDDKAVAEYRQELYSVAMRMKEEQCAVIG